MNPSDIAFIKGIVAFLVVGAAGFAFVGLWLRERRRALPQQMDDVIQGLRDENARTRDDLESRIAELEERVHFTERLLTKEPTPVRLPSVDERPPL